ncbi:MAG: glycosyltransferase, partial [Burkholderiales bacterium]
MTPPSNNPEIDQQQLAGKLEGILSSRRRRKPLFAELPASGTTLSRVGWAAKPNDSDGKKPLGFAAQPASCTRTAESPIRNAPESAGTPFNLREAIKSIPWIGAIAVRVYRRLRRLRQAHELAADTRIDRLDTGAIIALLTDLAHRCRQPLDLRAADAYWNKLNLLFVGPADESNRQWQLVDMLHELLYYSDRQVRLILAGSIGGTIDTGYRQRLEAHIAELGLQDSVEFAAEVSPDALLALYRSAD